MSLLQLLLRVPVAGLLLLAGSFGIAWHVVLAVRDFEFFSGMPGMKSQLAGAGIGMGLAFLLLWRYRKIMLIALAVLTVLMSGLLWFVLASGALSKPLHLMKEVGPATSQLRKEIEKAHAEGADAAGVEDLRNLGVFDGNDFLDGEYYGPDAYTWDARFDDKGRMVGEIRVAGDPSRNAPGWTSVPGPNRLSVLQHGDVREGLPILSRERERSKQAGDQVPK